MISSWLQRCGLPSASCSSPLRRLAGSRLSSCSSSSLANADLILCRRQSVHARSCLRRALFSAVPAGAHRELPNRQVVFRLSCRWDRYHSLIKAICLRRRSVCSARILILENRLPFASAYSVSIMEQPRGVPAQDGSCFALYGIVSKNNAEGGKGPFVCERIPALLQFRWLCAKAHIESPRLLR